MIDLARSRSQQDVEDRQVTKTKEWRPKPLPDAELETIVGDVRKR